MKSLIIYDSFFGNTKLIAQTIGKELGEETRIIHVSEFQGSMLQGLNLLVVGSPILGWRPSEKTQEFLNNLPELKDIKICTFDTRMNIIIHGDATKKMSEKLVTLGGDMIIKPQMFYVTGKEGPLAKGELEKAKELGKQLKSL
jgi:flavodoxin